MGVAADVIELARAAIAASNAQIGFAVWPENWHAVRVFLAMATQWNWGVGVARGCLFGMNYQALEFVVGSIRPTVPRGLRRRRWQLLEQVQLMEDTVLELNR
jgi:hypothetical protein